MHPVHGTALGRKRHQSPSADRPIIYVAALFLMSDPCEADEEFPAKVERSSGMSGIVLITGATGGIGSALTKRLAKEGRSLLLAARNMQSLMMLQSSVAVEGRSVASLSVDMTNLSSIERFADQLAADETVLNGVVLMPPQVPPIPDALPSSEVWQNLFHEHFAGPLALLKVAISRMRPNVMENRRAKVVIVSGISSVQVLSHYATNNVIRAAWLAQAKTLAFALGDKGIHVNTLSLGGTLSPHYAAMIQKRADAAGHSFDEQIAEETSNVPLRKYGSPDEVAGAIAALLADFSDHMTGVNILHYGGFTRSY
jgi:3-oxoacyl-[acyl-carrier protein] reductase